MAKIYAESFDSINPRLTIEQYLQPPGTWGLIARVRHDRNDSPVGYVLARNAADEAEVFSIGGAHMFQRTGVGTALLATMEKIARVRGAYSVFLEVGIDNCAGRALYRKYGYKVIGQRPEYYRNAVGDRLTALVLRKRLENMGGQS